MPWQSRWVICKPCREVVEDLLVLELGSVLAWFICCSLPSLTTLQPISPINIIAVSSTIPTCRDAFRGHRSGPGSVGAIRVDPHSCIGWKTCSP